MSQESDNMSETYSQMSSKSEIYIQNFIIIFGKYK